VNSKNKKAEYISYPDRLQEILIDQVKNKSGDRFLFQNQAQNGAVSKNTMNNRHSGLLKIAGLDAQHHTLYSWKHTGVVSAYEAGIDLKRIQLQCRHSTVAQTDQYLKSLGLYHNEEFTIRMPAIGT
jgi:integrase